MCGDSTEGIYTQKQIDEANSYEEKNLRDALLHNIRLRNLMTEDRDKFEKKCNFYEGKISEIRSILVTNNFKSDYKIIKRIENILNWNPGNKEG